MSLIYSGYFKGKPSTKERRTSKSSGVILIVKGLRPNFLKYISSTIVLFISFNHIINISSQSIFYSLTG